MICHTEVTQLQALYTTLRAQKGSRLRVPGIEAQGAWERGYVGRVMIMFSTDCSGTYQTVVTGYNKMLPIR